MADYKWYRAGSVSINKGSKTVTGINTDWLIAGVKAGDVLVINRQVYEIDEVKDSESLLLVDTFDKENIANSDYGIILRAEAVLLAELAADVQKAVLLWNKGSGSGISDEQLESKIREILESQTQTVIEEQIEAKVREILESQTQTVTDEQLEAKINEILETKTPTQTSTIAGRLGLYIDDSGDLAQDDDHITISGGSSEEDSGGVATEDDVNDMLDDVFNND